MYKPITTQTICRPEQFCIPDGTIYLDGNSLGPLPKQAKARGQRVIETEWGHGLITSWNKHQWIDLPEKVGNKIATLVGAKAGQVICCDTISVNLYKVLSAALKLQPTRKTVVTTIDNFPSDIYTIQGVASQHKDIRVELIDESAIVEHLNDDVAVLVLTQVNFRTGRKLDMAALTTAAHQKGILVIWDLAHSVGAFSLHLDACNVDFAVGCTYKYLNGGPGAPGFIYVAERHLEHYQQPITGWMGHTAPFDFVPEYIGANTIKQNLSGTPGVIGMSILDSALDVFLDVDMQAVENASTSLSTYFLQQMDVLGLLNEFELVSPQDSTQRGSQLAFSHSHSYAICQAWIASGVIADFRAPSILRIGFTPLYLSQADLDIALQRLLVIMDEKRYLSAEFQQRQQVT